MVSTWKGGLVVEMDTRRADECHPRLRQRTPQRREGLLGGLAGIGGVVVPGDLVEPPLVFAAVRLGVERVAGQDAHAPSFSANQRNVAGAQWSKYLKAQCPASA